MNVLEPVNVVILGEGRLKEFPNEHLADSYARKLHKKHIIVMTDPMYDVLYEYLHYNKIIYEKDYSKK